MAQYGTCPRCGTTFLLTGSNNKEAYGKCPNCKNPVREPLKK